MDSDGQMSKVYNPSDGISRYDPSGVVNGGGGGPVYQDLATFVGTNGTLLSAYTTQAGKTFVQYTADGVTPQGMPTLNGSGFETLAAAATYGDVLDTLTPATADYTVGETFTLANTTDQVAIFGRASSVANTNYVFGYGGAGTVFMYAIVAGAPTLLINQAFTWTAGATHTLTLSMVGTTITCQIDGITIDTPITDITISAKGQGGSRIYSILGGGATGTNFYIL